MILGRIIVEYYVEIAYSEISKIDSVAEDKMPSRMQVIFLKVDRRTKGGELQLQFT
ncbi:3241_t:CDS:2 [Gigaspora rosea]|nr:3241_t:CDS:2 [Gigaspora rosea]